MIALLATVAVSAISGLVFLRLRGPAAALATISMYFLFDKYISTCSWTGGASGIWQGVPHLSVTEQIAITLLAITCCATLYALFQRTNSSALVIAHGNSPLFAIAAAPMSPIVPLLVANCLVGFCAGCAGLVLTLQIGFIAPSTFSLNSGLLYAGTILLVGWRSLLPIAVGAIVFSFIPNVLRLCGLGESQSSAWQGVLVGAGVAALVWAQFPRMASSKTLRSCGQSIPATGYAKAINHPEP
jgi:branched-chain amino acid transport system permease protein